MLQCREMRGKVDREGRRVQPKVSWNLISHLEIALVGDGWLAKKGSQAVVRAEVRDVI